VLFVCWKAHARTSFSLARAADHSDRFAGGTENFAGSANNAMDAISEVLSGVKLNGAVFFCAEFSAPWGFSVSPPDVIAATLGLGLRTLCFTTW
jgi:hypothetical protein